jgi:hypothetical protein
LPHEILSNVWFATDNFLPNQITKLLFRKKQYKREDIEFSLSLSSKKTSLVEENFLIGTEHRVWQHQLIL